jgi:predicted small metal-binding protein
MDLYKAHISGFTYACNYSNHYLVAAENISEAVEKAIKEMKEKHNLKEVKVEKIELIEWGIIV